MASNIKGITIDINGDTTNLEQSLKAVTKRSKELETELKSVQKSLKMDPGNVELVRQKQELLTRSIESTSTKLQGLKEAQRQVEEQFRRGDLQEDQYRAFNRELANTEAQLRSLQTEYSMVDGEQERFRRNANDLQTYLNATGQSVDDLSNLLGNRLTTAIRNGSASTDQLELALQRIARQGGRTSEEIDLFRQTLRNVDNGSSLDEVRRDLQQIGQEADTSGDKLEGMGEKAKNAALVVSAAVTTFGIGAAVSAAQFDNAIGQLQASLGITREEAEKLEDSAKEVWKAGFGESLEEVTGSLIRVKQNMKAVNESDLGKVTKQATALAKQFNSDVNEVTRAANNLMISFGVSSEEAFDMLASGAQNGLNFSNELFDNVAEYASLWSSAGYSMEDYFNVLYSGTQESVYNLDYLNDILKEFNIRIKDNSDSTSDAMSVMSQATLDLWEAQYQGKATVSEVAASVINDLKSMENQVDANEIAVALFGR